MKKMMMVLLTLVTILSLTICAVAEEYEVAATITTTSEDEANALYAPEIPAGTLSADVFGFDAGQMYAVYSAPDVKSIRGASGKAKVSTNDWVQVFGREGSWLMVQYDVKDSFYRIGYISDKAIPVGMTVSELNLTNTASMTREAVSVTDDPLGGQGTLVDLPAESRVTRLGSMGDWSYIEGTQDGKLFRGFVPSGSLTDSTVVLSLEEAIRVLEGSWNVYAGDAGNTNYLRFTSDGTVYGRLTEDSEERRGQWSISHYDANRMLYWNDPEFELSISRPEGSFSYGLRICWEPYGTGGAKYALILSESENASGLVLCK